MLRTIAPFAVLASLAFAAQAHAQSAPTRTEEARPAPALKRFPAAPGDLVLSGEFAARDVAVYLSPVEAARASQLRLAVSSAISIAPERSQIAVFVNGRQVATGALEAGSTPRTLVADIAPGVLGAGYNAVRFVVNQRHRVDCSVAATYELWTSIDPLNSGFTGPAFAPANIRHIRDLPGLATATDGASNVRLRLPPSGDPALLSAALEAAQAIILSARLRRPVIDVDPEPGEGPGLDIVFSGTGIDPVAGAPGHLSVVQGPEGRSVVGVMLGQGRPLSEDLAAAMGDAAATGTPAGLQARQLADGLPIGPRQTVTLADLGYPGVAFAGRRLSVAGRLDLPANFLPGDYGAVDVAIDADYARELAAGSAIVVRVNGHDAAALDLPSDGGGSLRRQQFKVPLRFFRPGANVVAFEATTPAASDKACDLSGPQAARLQLGPGTSLSFGTLAEVATVPEMATLLSGGYPMAPGEPLQVFAAAEDAGAAATVVAGIATARKAIVPVTLRTSELPDQRQSGLVVSRLDRLGVDLTALATRNAALPATWPGQVTATLAGGGIGGAQPDARGFLAKPAAWLSALGFRFGSDGFSGGPVPVPENGVLAAMIAPLERQAGLFGRQPAQLIVTAADADMLQSGIRALVASGSLPALSGETASFDPSSGAVRVAAAAAPSYVLPGIAAAGQVRYALAGMLSNNLGAYVLLVLGACLALGVCTNRFVRRLGVRP